MYDFPEYHIDREFNITHFRGNVLKIPTCLYGWEYLAPKAIPWGTEFIL